MRMTLRWQSTCVSFYYRIMLGNPTDKRQLPWSSGYVTSLSSGKSKVRVVSYLPMVCGFVRVPRFPPPLKPTATIWPKMLKVALNTNQSINLYYGFFFFFFLRPPFQAHTFLFVYAWYSAFNFSATWAEYLRLQLYMWNPPLTRLGPEPGISRPQALRSTDWANGLHMWGYLILYMDK